MAGALPTIPDGWEQFLAFTGFDFICEVDRQARYLHLSPNYAAFFAVAPTQLLGRSPFELGLLHPEDLPALESELRPLFERDEPVKARYRVRSGTGEWHWVESAGHPAQDSEGRWRAIFISRDITAQVRAEQALAQQEALFIQEGLDERRRAQEALRDSEAQNRALLSAIPDLIFLNRSDGTFLAFHAADPAALFAPPEAFLHLKPEQVFPAEFADRFRQAFASALESGEIQYLTYSLPVKGQDGFFEARIVPCTADTFLTIIRDRTEEHRQEAQLQQTQKLESLGVLAGGIAHDFNNLLTAAMGNLNLAQLKLPPGALAHPHLEAIEKIVLKASDLTRQMLAYSGKGRFVVRRHDLNEVVREMGHLLQVSISKKVALDLELAENLPGLEGDATQIQQVIMNLVTNASDAIGAEAGAITIRTGQEDLSAADLAAGFAAQPMAPGRFATLEVRDTGSGIAPEILPRIFDPFFSTKASGRGLGLSAMQGILRGHGAGLRIQSEPGRGTTFRIYFPARAAAPPERPADAAQAPERGQLSGLVLVVDDEPTILETLRASLESFGLQVITACDGLDALERFQAEPRPIALVLMDLTMPRMDGREAFRRLRQLDPTVRVLLSSGYNQQESIQEFQGKGLAGFLQKPYRLADLKRALLAALDSDA